MTRRWVRFDEPVCFWSCDYFGDCGAASSRLHSAVERIEAGMMLRTAVEVERMGSPPPPLVEGLELFQLGWALPHLGLPHMPAGWAMHV